jgi:mono/diheme cytochrome c family protein
MRLGLRRVLLALVSAVLLPRVEARADEPPEYGRDIKPLLERHCFECHGARQQESGLRLDVKEAALKGGESKEPAIVPGSSEKSRLIRLITSDDPKARMPHEAEALKPEEVALLRKWIDAGAHWTEPGEPAAAPPAEAARKITDQDRQFWSFTPPKHVEPPATKNTAWPRGSIDRFVLARLESRGLSPAGEAPRRVLVRRLTYDLTGLPPTPEEVEAFVADTGADAVERLVDRLLASPRFGERMASLWLPLARYAEDQAHQVGSDTKFFYPNAWKYREWVVNAFNRDLPYDNFLRYQLAADKVDGAKPEDLAALGFLGLGPKYYDRSRVAVMADEWEDRVDTVTRTMLGLTVACARCHDHKFDPVTQEDYYALAGVFASTKMVNKVPGGAAQKGELDAEKVDSAAVHAVEDGDVHDLNVFLRGSAERKGPVAPRRFLAVLSPGEPAPFKNGSGRKELADAIADPHNPLTARVFVNRVWGMLLGAPLVATPSNFGHSGMAPTYPALLDDTAVRFTEGGWSIKKLVREIVLSSTYRQASVGNGSVAATDPGNELLWRMNRRRLTVEQWRDGVLFVCGNLQDGGGKSMELGDPKNLRRTLYARISRLKLNDVLVQFDYPDANVHAEKRSVTSTPAQKLFMLNSPFILRQAKALAERLHRDAPAGDDAARIDRAYRLVYARPPEPAELSLGLEFLHRPAAAADSSAPVPTRWEQYAQILLASNEAMYVD